MCLCPPSSPVFIVLSPDLHSLISDRPTHARTHELPSIRLQEATSARTVRGDNESALLLLLLPLPRMLRVGIKQPSHVVLFSRVLHVCMDKGSVCAWPTRTGARKAGMCGWAYAVVVFHVDPRSCLGAYACTNKTTAECVVWRVPVNFRCQRTQSKAQRSSKSATATRITTATAALTLTHAQRPSRLETSAPMQSSVSVSFPLFVLFCCFT